MTHVGTFRNGGASSSQTPNVPITPSTHTRAPHSERRPARRRTTFEYCHNNDNDREDGVGLDHDAMALPRGVSSPKSPTNHDHGWMTCQQAKTASQDAGRILISIRWSSKIKYINIVLLVSNKKSRGLEAPHCSDAHARAVCCAVAVDLPQ
mmetsp:Transcript_20760/g.44954  ORF Transcript_20760/g.44954 Transcript_20760/m.44954 type:complete len:151 (+) Transcript_20760:96-548(+)|eukprot:CAMPEP_0168750646 /NCGR_PEP_ID=MMETSP0724-20121128/17389_1 /TAXON_ID=265536 /ORGANISM="Amphiprora sp., Strain CCMP467" /LENGTH=150 /DNA_ID=CAMNT_0008798693 /DNA_START=105 /DNA_END=557 /DNA_ORIENTATION=-